MSFGLSDTGFLKKTYGDILAEMQLDARGYFGEDFDLRDGAPQAQLLAVLATQCAYKWETMEDVYFGRFVAQASGNTLSYLVRNRGLRRFQAQYAETVCTFSGTDGTIIPINFAVATETGIEFKTIQSGTISGGVVDISMIATESGIAGNVAADSLIVIVSPLLGLDSVTNASAAENGRDQERDDELKLRYFESAAAGGGSTGNALKAYLLSQVTNVTDVEIVENRTETTVDGRPPHCFEAYVLGGIAADIYDAIYEMAPLGIRSFGDNTQEMPSGGGTTITIAFSRPTEIDIWIDATVTRGSNYPLDGDTQVENAILYFVNSSLKISDDLYIFQLSTYIATQVEGIDNLLIETSLNGIDYDAVDVTIDELEKAVTDSGKIDIL